MRFVLLGMFALLLSGCAQPGGIFSDSNLVCSNMGYTEGTPEFSSCVFQNQQLRMQRGAALSAWGAQQQQLGQPRPINPGFTCVQQGPFTRCW